MELNRLVELRDRLLARVPLVPRGAAALSAISGVRSIDAWISAMKSSWVSASSGCPARIWHLICRCSTLLRPLLEGRRAKLVVAPARSPSSICWYAYSAAYSGRAGASRARPVDEGERELQHARVAPREARQRPATR